jgi:hypothetical protein
MDGGALAFAWLALFAAADAGAPPGLNGARAVPFTITPGADPAPPAGAAYDLRPAEGGSLAYEDEHINARVAPDGQVTFKNRVPIDLRWLPFLPSPHPPGTETLQSSLLSLIGGRMPGLPPPPEMALPPAPPTLADSTNDRRKRDLGYPAKVLPFLKGETDLYDLYLVLMGRDPYAKEKARFLAATFERRVAMATRARARAVRQAGADLGAQLEALWAEPSRPLFERKRLLCQLWTEIDGGDPAGRAAALTIERFAAQKLPAASAGRYTAAELDACHAGAGDRRRFDPYAPSDAGAGP